MSDRVLDEIQAALPNRAVAWAEPPPSRQGNHTRGPREGRASYASVLRLLRAAAPGQWLRIGVYGTCSQFAVMQKRAKADGFEALSRTREDGTFDFYIRWPE